MRDFIGHEALINNFKQRCLKNTLSHAHLIAGEDGVGKGKLANILAKFILNGYLEVLRLNRNPEIQVKNHHLE